jgi:peptide deformylase
MDHLDGIVFVDHLSRLKRNRIVNKLRKQQQKVV